MGEKRNCFNKAAVYAINREDVLYAEGYAIQPGLPFPVQHAWLVDPTGAVIDPTWKDTSDHVYLGIAFRRDFVLSMLNLSGGQRGKPGAVQLDQQEMTDEACWLERSCILPASKLAGVR